MTLEKHILDGISPIKTKTMIASEFEELLINAGYQKIGFAPAQGQRLKVWWNHPVFRRIESIYSPDGLIVITAYHP